MTATAYRPRRSGIGAPAPPAPKPQGLVQRVVPPFAELHFSGALRLTAAHPTGIIHWDGDAHCVQPTSRMFGQNREMAWGPRHPDANHAEWVKSQNTVAARWLREAWARVPDLRHHLGELQWKTIRQFSDEFLGRLPHEWELHGSAVLAWLYLGSVPDFCCVTQRMRDEAMRQHLAAVQENWNSPGRLAERAKILANVKGGK